MQWRALGTAALMAAAVMGCDKTPKKAPSQRVPHPDEDMSLAASDALALGRDVIVLADRAHDFTASHRGRPPKGMRDLGVDSLTPTLARAIQTTDSLRVRVAFRTLEGHALGSCLVSLSALEEADLNSGEFSLHCRTVAGVDTTVRTTARR